MKKDLNIKSKFIYGIRERHKSFKLYKIESGGYFILLKKYILNICYRRKYYNFNKLFEAEDFLIQNTNGFGQIKIPDINGNDSKK